jgi:hypothetical protein
MNDKKFTQEGAEGAHLYQAAGGIAVHHHGLTYAEAKDLILTTVERSFADLSAQALIVAKARAEEMTSQYLSGIAAKNPNLVEAVEDPGIQLALLAAQKEFIKTGDTDLGKLLTSMLVERTGQPQRTMLQITLDESLPVAGKLTNSHVKIILLSFLINNLLRGTIFSLAQLEGYFEKYIKPLVPFLSKSRTVYEHLFAVNCAHTPTTLRHFLETYIRRYPGLLNRGFNPQQRKLNHPYLLDKVKYPLIFTTCLHNKQNIQINAANEQMLLFAVGEYNLSTDAIDELKFLLNELVFDIDEAADYFRTYGSYMQDLMVAWDNTQFSQLNLNNIGKVIAIAAYQVEFDEPLRFNIWIDE